MEIFELQGEYMRKMSEAEFYRFCRDNRDLRIERKANGEIEFISPTGFDTGMVNLVISSELYEWFQSRKTGKIVGPDTGFTLPNGAIRSPDAAWVSEERAAAISKADKKRFPHICPDFVVELKSEGDAIQGLQEKMEEWIANGCRLSWLIDPEEEVVYIYREDGSCEEVHGFEQKLSGEEVLTGFELDLRKLKQQ